MERNETTSAQSRPETIDNATSPVPAATASLASSTTTNGGRQ